MSASESIEFLSTLGVIEWAEKQPNEALNIFVNGLTDHFLEDRAPFNFRPFIESDAAYDYFLETRWDLDWFSLFNGTFVEALDINIDAVASSVCDHESGWDKKL